MVFTWCHSGHVGGPWTFDNFFCLERQHGPPVLVFCCLWGLCETIYFSIIPYTVDRGTGRIWVYRFCLFVQLALIIYSFCPILYDLLYRKNLWSVQAASRFNLDPELSTSLSPDVTFISLECTLIALNKEKLTLQCKTFVLIKSFCTNNASCFTERCRTPKQWIFSRRLDPTLWCPTLPSISGPRRD